MRSLSTSTDCVDRFFKAFIVMKAIISDNSFTRGFHLLRTFLSEWSKMTRMEIIIGLWLFLLWCAKRTD